MPEKETNPITDQITQARQRLAEEVRAQADELEKLEQSLQALQKLEQSLQALRSRHQQLEQAVGQQLEKVAATVDSMPTASQAVAEALNKVLASVRNLITATLPNQVFDTLVEEAHQLGVRAAVFDIRGKAAWGASSRGFDLTENAFRALAVPLNKDNAFRQAYETGGHVDASADILKKSKNIYDKFKPKPDEQVFLLPVRSAGMVSAIFYADPGGTGRDLPVDGLKILAEFAGAQLDRLMALSGGIPSAGEQDSEEAVGPSSPGAAAAVEVGESENRAQAAPAAASVQASASAVAEAAPVIEASAPVAERPAAGTFDISQLSEEDQRVHKDARRFAKLLISEIDLYNKPKVADGRKNADLYRRLKTDIDRSRQTYEKRFGKTVAKQVDYFHDEVVRTLASNDSSLLGSDYPGPSV